MLDFFASNRLSVFNIGILTNPNNCKENIMIIIPAIILNVSEFFNKAWLKKDADAPSKMKTVEKPKQNKKLSNKNDYSKKVVGQVYQEIRLSDKFTSKVIKKFLLKFKQGSLTSVSYLHSLSSKRPISELISSVE